MAEPNHAGNIIINLASLPDFLRKPILTKRMEEFFAMSESEKTEIIMNALNAGPTVPFPNFAKLLRTWLEVMATFPQKYRYELFDSYVHHVSKSPQKLIRFHLDGMLEVFLTLDNNQRDVISQSIKTIIGALPEQERRTILAVIPDNAKKQLDV